MGFVVVEISLSFEVLGTFFKPCIWKASFLSALVFIALATMHTKVLSMLHLQHNVNAKQEGACEKKKRPMHSLSDSFVWLAEVYLRLCPAQKICIKNNLSAHRT